MTAKWNYSKNNFYLCSHLSHGQHQKGGMTKDYEIKMD